VQEDQHAALGVVGDAVDDLRALKGSALLRASVATLRGGASGAPHRYLLYGLVRHEDVGLARRPQHTVAREEGKCVPAPAQQGPAPFQAVSRRGGPRYQPHLSRHERHFKQQQQNKKWACMQLWRGTGAHWLTHLGVTSIIASTTASAAPKSALAAPAVACTGAPANGIRQSSDLSARPDGVPALRRTHPFCPQRCTR